METKMTTTDTPRTDAFGNNLVKCYCPRCIVGVHDDIQLAAQYRKHAEWRERAEKAEAEVERLRSTMRSFILVSPIEFERMEKIEAEVESLNSRMVELKHNQASLIAAINTAITEFPSNQASIYLSGIMEKLFQK